MDAKKRPVRFPKHRADDAVGAGVLQNRSLPLRMGLLRSLRASIYDLSTACRQNVYNSDPSKRQVDLGTKPTRPEIHAELRERILLLDLPPGTRLREEHLARDFGVSRTPIRQVLDRLEFEGLVVQGEGSGARVSSLETKALRDIWAVRLRIAELVGDFISLPAPVPMTQRVEALASELAEIRESRDLRALGALYNRFHEIMLEVVNNDALVRIHDLLYVQTARNWMQFLPEMDLDREIDVMAEEIEDTVEALSGTSGAELARIRKEHMGRLLSRFNEHVTSFPMISV